MHEGDLFELDDNRGFSLVELIIAVAIMAILAGVLSAALIKYINKSRNVMDGDNGNKLYEVLMNAMADSPDNTIDTSSPWSGDANKNHGYIYVDDDEIRVSSLDIAKLLEENGVLAGGTASNYTARSKETTYKFTKKQIAKNMLCRSKKPWDRYQVNFILNESTGEIEFSCTASIGNKSVDVDATEAYAASSGLTPNTTLSMGEKN